MICRMNPLLLEGACGGRFIAKEWRREGRGAGSRLRGLHRPWPNGPRHATLWQEGQGALRARLVQGGAAAGNPAALR